MRHSTTLRSLLFTSTLVAVFAAAGCSSNTNENSSATSGHTQSSQSQSNHEHAHETATVQLAGPVSPPSIPMLKMVEDQSLGEDVELEFSSWSTPDELTGYITGGYDFIAAPLTTGAMLYNKGIPIQQLNVSAWDVMDLVTTDPNVNTIADLEGKTIYISMKGSAVDYSTQVILAANGLTPGENVTLEYIAPTEGVPQLLAGSIDTLVTVEPQVTAVMSQSDTAHSVVDFAEEWKKATDSQEKLPTAGILVSDDFAAENPDITDQFQKAYAEAAQWVVDNPDEVGALAEKYLGIDAKVFAKAVPAIDWDVKDAQEARPATDLYFETLYALDPASVGGELPADEFYYSGK